MSSPAFALRASFVVEEESSLLLMWRTCGVSRSLGASHCAVWLVRFFFQAEDGIRDLTVTGVQTCALPISMRGMLIAAGVRNVPSQVSGPLKPRGTAPGLTRSGETLVKGDGGELGLALTLFKALQLLHAKDLETVLERYVTFDFETTDNDVTTCGVVEIGAARVVKGEMVDRFHTLVQPYQPISSRASAIHGYTDDDVRDAPSFAQVWPEFRAFVGDDGLIAPNRSEE